MGATSTNGLLAALLVVGLAGCETKPTKVSRPTDANPPNRCEAHVTELRGWLRTLAEEGDVRPELVRAADDRSTGRRFPSITVVRLEERPSPLPVAAFVELEGAVARFADVRGRANDPAALARVFRAAVESGYSSRPSNGSGRARHPVVLAVSPRETWKDVVSVVEAGRRAGFRQALFVFEVPTHASAPAPAGAAARIRALATDPVEMPWKRDVAIAGELARANPRCPAIAKPFEAPAGDSAVMEAQLTAFLAEVPGAVTACRCDADLDAIRAFAWARFGRHWGPPTVTHTLELAAEGEASARVAQPAGSPWSTAHAAVLEAAKRPTPAVLATE